MDGATRLDRCNLDIRVWSNGLNPLEAGTKTDAPQVIYIPVSMETPKSAPGEGIIHIQCNTVRHAEFSAGEFPIRVTGCFGVLGDPQLPLGR